MNKSRQPTYQHSRAHRRRARPLQHAVDGLQRHAGFALALEVLEVGPPVGRAHRDGDRAEAAQRPGVADAPALKARGRQGCAVRCEIAREGQHGFGVWWGAREACGGGREGRGGCAGGPRAARLCVVEQRPLTEVRSLQAGPAGHISAPQSHDLPFRSDALCRI